MKLTTTFFGLFFTSILFAQNVNIPDTNFKNVLVNYIYFDANQNQYNLDANNDGEIQISEANNYTGVLDISSQGISNLTGLEAFTKISELHCGGSNNFTVLDLKFNTELVVVYCDNSGKIENINISLNTKLEELYCQGNNLDDLDITKNIVLTELDCSNNQLTQIDFTNNILLNQVVVNDNKLTTLNIDALENLTGLYCNNVFFGTSNLSNLDFSKNLKLQYIELKSVNLSTIDISKNIDLLHINLMNNMLSGYFDLSSHDDLIHVYLSNNNFKGINVANGFNNNSNASFRLQTLWTDGNFNLEYICVDDVNYANSQSLNVGQTDSWIKESESIYTTNCSLSSKKESLMNVAIYPNPFKENLKIVNLSKKIKSIEIYNYLGKKLLTNYQNIINTTTLNRGVYLLKIESVDKSVIYKKVIKN